MAQPNPKSSSLCRKIGLRLLIYPAVFFVLFLIFRSQILMGAALFWAVNDVPEKSDAILVLGGNAPMRAMEAARLYHQGFAPKILIVSNELTALNKLGLVISEVEIVEKILALEKVPTNAYEKIGFQVSSTREEIQATRDWLEKNEAKRLLIVTDVFHTRRVKRYFKKYLRSTGVQIRIIPHDYGRCVRWWKEEGDLIDFQNEVIKYGYYMLKY